MPQSSMIVFPMYLRMMQLRPTSLPAPMGMMRIVSWSSSAPRGVVSEGIRADETAISDTQAQMDT